MKNKTTKSYGKRTDKSMKAVVRLERLRLKIHNKTVNYLNNFNLTFNQFKVLEVLYHRGDLNISSITKLTMSTPGNITVVIKNLKRDGWIATIPDKKDKRASILTLTNKGQEVIEEVFPLHAKNLYNWMEVLNDEELDTLYELLNKLYKAN
ncbi:transcriptional regulator, MarR family [Malaciobacter marinus]|uniref:MarR family transcriptional regulator n=1 Tax=Malaciobacter marinus TaxID=505249 RepID=A0A347TH67_9BACT|nr:MarR family transcriptional regulator [Malaciobacter marinus]AXX85945.1 transcriptional regulator, MarR family [Malaciobacter marinus]PHO15369.1 MarR family transcriptional regulator [Malaciobacter marinus]